LWVGLRCRPSCRPAFALGHEYSGHRTKVLGSLLERTVSGQSLAGNIAVNQPREAIEGWSTAKYWASFLVTASRAAGERFLSGMHGTNSLIPSFPSYVVPELRRGRRPVAGFGPLLTKARIAVWGPIARVNFSAKSNHAPAVLGALECWRTRRHLSDCSLVRDDRATSKAICAAAASGVWYSGPRPRR